MVIITLQMSTELLCIEPSYRKGMEEYLFSAICTASSLKMLSGDGDGDDDMMFVQLLFVVTVMTFLYIHIVIIVKMPVLTW